MACPACRSPGGAGTARWCSARSGRVEQLPTSLCSVTIACLSSCSGGLYQPRVGRGSRPRQQERPRGRWPLRAPHARAGRHRGQRPLVRGLFAAGSEAGQGETRPFGSRRWTSKAQTRLELFRWLSYYNRRRRHSAPGYLAPAEYEQQLITSRTLSHVAYPVSAPGDQPHPPQWTAETRTALRYGCATGRRLANFPCLPRQFRAV